MSKTKSRIFTALLSLMLVMALAPIAFADSSGVTVDKTATEVNAESKETNIELSVSSKDENIASDIVFVLDKSGASDMTGINKKAMEFLENLSKQAKEKDLNVKVGVVLFSSVGNVKLELTDIAKGYDKIKSAMTSSVSFGTNMHAGLLAGKKLLDDDVKVSNSRKHLVLITDGATYLYSKDSNYTKSYTRSFGDPKAQTDPVTGHPYKNSRDMKGGIWEYQSREYNVKEDLTFSDAMKNPDTLEKYLTEKRKHDDEYSKYEYAYTLSSAYLGIGRKVTPISKDAVANIDAAFIHADDTFQDIAKNYNTYVYFKNAADFDGMNFLKYMTRAAGGLSSDFVTLEKAVNISVDKGSSIDDVISKDFEFVNNPDKIKVIVGDEKLEAVKIYENEYGFGKKDDGSYRYQLSFDGTKNLHFVISEPVRTNVPLKLSYYEKLLNAPTNEGTYSYETNEKAVLTAVDSSGTPTGLIEFPKPKATYVVKALNRTVTFIDGDKTHAKVKVENGKDIDNDGLTDESMPQNPTKSGYTFKEWNTQKDGKGTAFTGTTVVNKDITVYAIYSKNAGIINSAPTLEVKDKTIKQGEKLDLMSLVVSAKDKEDGDLKDKVSIVDDGGFSKDKVGKYTVTFKITDSKGASSTKKATVTVVEKDKPTPNTNDNKPKPNPDNNKPQTLNNMTLPKTGDSSNLALYGTLMGLSGLLLIAVGIRKRRKES